MDEHPGVQPGMIFGSIQGISQIGVRHFDVAAVLKEFPVGSDFTMEMLVPLVAGETLSSDAPANCKAKRKKRKLPTVPRMSCQHNSSGRTTW
jgi:hypothetical protein